MKKKTEVETANHDWTPRFIAGNLEADFSCLLFFSQNVNKLTHVQHVFKLSLETWVKQFN